MRNGKPKTTEGERSLATRLPRFETKSSKPDPLPQKREELDTASRYAQFNRRFPFLRKWIRCHKILGPPFEWAPWGPILLTLWGPHRDFGAPFELALLARREVAFDTANYPMQSCQNLTSIL